MAMFNKNIAGSDDEDDIEFLRLAALKSLKQKNHISVQNKHPECIPVKPQHSFKPTFGAAQTTRHHNRGFRNNLGRGRNGMCSRARTNTNLISIQTIDQNETKEREENVCVEVPKLVLPQDRYHKPQVASNSKETASNKFDRYDNSDESESDSDEQIVKPARRERKGSLELLMDALENEINVLDGKTDDVNVEESLEKDADVAKHLRKSQNLAVDEDDLKSSENPDPATKDVENMLIISENCSDLIQTNNVCSEESKGVHSAKSLSPALMPIYKSRSRSPQVSPKRMHNSTPKRKTLSRSPPARQRSPFENQYKSPYRSPRSRSPPRKIRYSPAHYGRPLSPLALNTEVLNTLAPLSPRSAAFVLQNRQIIARRQMSPRRSSSRGRSLSRSLSPKRCKMSPRRRSRSPRFESSRKCSLSPRKKSISPRPSPKRRSTSPRSHRRRSPNYRSDNKPLSSARPLKRNSHSPLLKHPMHKRLGSRPTSRNVSPHYDYDRKTDVAQVSKRKRDSRSLSLSLSPSPDRNYHRRPLNDTTGHVDLDHKRPRDRDRRKESPVHIRNTESNVKVEEKSLDPVLEARKRKFESPMQIEKNGIIKLKTHKSGEQTEWKDDNEEMQQREGSENEENYELGEEEGEELDEGILELNPTIDDLWSDDESDNENEGRFKSSTNTQSKHVAVIPFRKLTEKSVLKLPLLPRDTNDHRNDRKHSKRPKNYSRKRSRSPLKTSTNRSESKSYTKDRSEYLDSSSQREKHGDKSSEGKSKVKVPTEKIRYKPIVEEKKKEKIISEVKDEGQKKVEVIKSVLPEKTVSRKVKIQKILEVTTAENTVENDDEPEIIVENEEEDIIPNKDDDGDLRAELSRRRAQRLIKAGSLAESLPARLLKSALQEVVPKRPTVKQSKVPKGSGNSADRRVLILKRLASSPAPRLEPANKVSKKEVKLPIHMRLGSTNVTDVPLDDIVRSDRRKRSRSGRRKKAAVQV
ncbi:hypothetical protein CBL_09371 [Carabus blaptoides fortunei]